MKIIDLKKANIVLLVMAIFMSCQVSVFGIRWAYYSKNSCKTGLG